jgi:hypothetical protein
VARYTLGSPSSIGSLPSSTTTAAAISPRTVTEEQLNELYRTLSPRCGGKREDYFGVAYIANRFKVPADKILSNVAFGGTEYGIDGYFLDKPNKTLHIFVFKWSENHMSFKDPLAKLGSKGIDKIFMDVTKSPDDPPMITFLKTELFQNWKAIDKVIIDFVFNGDPVYAEQSKVLSFLRETIEDKGGIIDSYFSRVDRTEGHAQVFRYVSNQRSLGHSVIARDSVEYAVELAETLSIHGGQNEMIVALLPLKTLYEMYSDLGERLFEKNIRSGLDEGSMTNSHIKKALSQIASGQDQPWNFTLYHNGITITAQKLDADGSMLRMIEPRVLNGAQTIKIVKEFVDEQPGNGTAKLTEPLAAIKVMARIIRSNDSEFLKKVTINNNRQNPIMPWNLRANDIVQMGFEEQFAKLGIYYERRENAYKNLTDENLEMEGIEKGVIEIRKFAQTLLAMQGQIDRISEMNEVFENENWYAYTFKERYLEVDPSKLVLIYKIQFRLPTLIREIRNAGGEKFGFIAKARNLVWCLVLQGLLNDDNFIKYVEYYGKSTGIEVKLAEVLKSIARTKICPILADALEDKKYKTGIAEGRLSFLASKSMLKTCMDKARNRFGWEKLYI